MKHKCVHIPVRILLVICALLVISIPIYTKAQSTTLVISEVYYDPFETEPDYEWVEIYNLGSGAVDLSNYKIGDEETPGAGEGMMSFPDGTILPPGEGIVIANKADSFMILYGSNPDFEMNDTDASVPDLLDYRSWALGYVYFGNSGDEVLILNDADALVDAVSWGNSNWAFDPDCPDVPQGHSLERNPATQDTDTDADWIDQDTPNPGFIPTAISLIEFTGRSGNSSSFLIIFALLLVVVIEGMISLLYYRIFLSKPGIEH